MLQERLLRFGFYADRKRGDAEARGEARGPLIVARACAGAVAGVMAWGVTYPCDVIRNRMMADYYRRECTGGWSIASSSSSSTNTPSSTTTSIVRYGREILRTDGVRGLYRGFGFTVTRAAPVAMVTLPAYETAYNFWLSRFRF